MVPWRWLKKSKNDSKNSFFLYFGPKNHFSFRQAYFQSGAAGKKLINWRKKKLGPFFSQNQLFWLKFGDFVKKSKNRSKNRVFENFRLKFAIFFSRVYFQSVTTYNKFISWKSKNKSEIVFLRILSSDLDLLFGKCISSRF